MDTGNDFNSSIKMLHRRSLDVSSSISVIFVSFTYTATFFTYLCVVNVGSH